MAAMPRYVLPFADRSHHPRSADMSQTLGAASAVGKTLSKAIYVFSPDEETGKVAHLNYLPKDILSTKKLDAKTWLGEVSKIIGGKVRGHASRDNARGVRGAILTIRLQGGGKDDSATGVGSETGKINEAVEEARRVYKSRIEA